MAALSQTDICSLLAVLYAEKHTSPEDPPEKVFDTYFKALCDMKKRDDHYNPNSQQKH